MIIRVGFLVVASVAAFSFSGINIGYPRKPNTGSQIKLPDTHESDLQQQQMEEKEDEKLEASMVLEPSLSLWHTTMLELILLAKNLKSFNQNFYMLQDEEEKEWKEIIDKMQRNLKPGFSGKRGCEEFGFLIREKGLNNVTEKGLLQSLVKEVEQKKVTIGRKLLELYGLKEQKSYLAQLRKQLKDKTAEIDTLKISVDSLQVERKKLHEEIKLGFLAEKELEMAKKMLKGMREEKDANAIHMMGQLIALEKQVSRFQSDGISFGGTMVEKKLESVKDFELVVVEMKRKNKELELEKRELATKLVVLKARIAALSNISQDEIIAKVKKEATSLRQANEELEDQAEKLQKNRFDMVQELVYQRWVHTCLRFEIQNHEYQSRKTAKFESRKASSPEFHEKTKPSIPDLGFDSTSSNTSSVESDEIDSSTFDSSSSGQSCSSKRSGVIHKIKKWGRSNVATTGVSPAPQARTRRRFSLSMLPSNPPPLQRKGDTAIFTRSRKTEARACTKSPDTVTFPRARRVSFNDAVQTMEPTYLDIAKSVEGMLDEKETLAMGFGRSLSVDSGHTCRSEFKGEIHAPESSSATHTKGDNDHASGIRGEIINMHEASRTEVALGEKLHLTTPQVLPMDSRVKSYVLHIAAALFFIFVLLVYFLYFSARKY